MQVAGKLQSRSLHGLWIISLIIMISCVALPSTILVHPARAAGAGVLLVSPAHIVPQPVGNTVIYQVRVSNMDPFNAWDIMVKTTQSGIDPVSVSIAGNVLGTPLLEPVNCVNGGNGGDNSAPGNIGCGVKDGPGMVHSAAVFKDSAVPGTSGLLFTINYKVGTGAYSPVTIFNDVIGNAGSNVDHTTTAADYGTPPGILPIANFTWTPLDPFAGESMTFNATSSSDPNPGHKIVSYTWDFKDQSKIEPHTSPILNHTFAGPGSSPLIGNFSVTLTVTDDLGLDGSVTHLVIIKNLPFHDIAVRSIDVPKDNWIIPGTPVTINVTVINQGTFPEKGFNLTVTVDNTVLLPLVNYTGGLATNHRITVGPWTWNTSGRPVGTYGVKAELMPLRAENGTIIENNQCPTKSCLTNNIRYHYVRIAIPQGSSLISLSMGQSLGLVVGVLAAAGAAWSIIGGRLDKRRRLAAEALP